METVAVIIPTLNEESLIGKVIDDVPVVELLQNVLETAVCVIDRQSTDHTREIAVGKGGHVMLAHGRDNAASQKRASPPQVSCSSVSEFRTR
jgi:glycosyltransferase involved in cell wall biosynthesis